MSSQSDAMSQSSVESQAVVTPLSLPTRPLYWSVRRELWENRFVYIAPVAVAAVFLVGYLITLTHLAAQMRGLSVGDTEQYREAILKPYNVAAAFMMGAYILVILFYCADALHGERRDRSILFWKSLPVSDLTTVLAKLSVPFIVLPLLTFAITLVLQWAVLLISSAVLTANGMNVSIFWSHLPILQMSLLMLYHIITAHTLWPAPVYCWLLLVSGWARRAAFLWAALPVLAIAGVEQIAFHTQHFITLVAHRLIGASAPTDYRSSHFPTDPMTHIMPGHFLSDPSLWIGLAIAALFVALAVRLRRYEGPI